MKRWRVIGWVVSVVALAFVGKWLWQLDRRVWSELGHLQPAYLAAALVLFLGWFVTRFYAWRVISRRHGMQHEVKQNIRMWAVSEIMRYIPGGLWSYVGRWRGSVAAGVTKGAAVQSVIIEATGLVGGASALTIVVVQPGWRWYGAAAIVFYVGLAPWALRLLSRKFNMGDHRSLTWLELSRLMLLYVASWALFGAAHAAIYHSFPTPPPISTAHLIGYSVFAWLLGYLSLTPMGLGVREASLSGLLRSTEAVSLGFATLLSVVSRLWLVISEFVFLGLVLLFTKKK